MGDVAGLTLLQNGVVNGQVKYTAISDNEGPLMWTAGKAPSNSGNAAKPMAVVDCGREDGPSAVGIESRRRSRTRTGVVSTGKAVVRKAMPVASASVISTNPVVPVAGVEAATATEVTVVSTASPLPSEMSVVAETNVAVVVVPEIISAGNMVQPMARPMDAGASLSLAAVGNGKSGAAPVVGTSSSKGSTGAMDEVYRVLGTLMESAAVQ